MSLENTAEEVSKNKSDVSEHKQTNIAIMDIEIKISKNEIVRTTIIEPVKEPSTMTALLTSLKSVKQQSNDTMTNFVNAEKTSGALKAPSKRKDQDDDSESHSDAETDEDRSIKKLRSDDESVEQSC